MSVDFQFQSPVPPNFPISHLYHDLSSFRTLISAIEIHGPVVTIYNHQSEPEMSYVFGTIMVTSKTRQVLELSNYNISIVKETDREHDGLHLTTDFTPYHTHFRFHNQDFLTFQDLLRFLSSIVKFQNSHSYRDFLMKDLRSLLARQKKKVPEEWNTKRMFFPPEELQKVFEWVEPLMGELEKVKKEKKIKEESNEAGEDGEGEEEILSSSSLPNYNFLTQSDPRPFNDASSSLHAPNLDSKLNLAGSFSSLSNRWLFSGSEEVLRFEVVAVAALLFFPLLWVWKQHHKIGQKRKRRPSK